MDITRLRTERKMKEKLLVGTAQGQIMQANKRIKKTLKKKEKHRDKVLQHSLTR